MKTIKINEITERELRDLEYFEQERQRLHLPPVPKTFIQLDVHMPNGEHVLEYKTRSKSWVRNAYNVFTSQMLDIIGDSGGVTYGAGKLPIKKLDGSVLNNETGEWNMGSGNIGSYTGGAGVVTKGIVVGTGVVAENFEDHILGTLIANGTGAGQLSYVGGTNGVGVYDGGTKKWTATHVRIMNNNSGGEIVVGEVAIYANINSFSYGMICRDLLGVPVAVANTAQLTVTYTIDITYPY
jgi:hypothetical protein